MKDILHLLNKYDVPIPRYTSYPPVPNWRTPPTEEEWMLSISNHLKASSASVYIHIPFCQKLCSFCACNKIITANYNLAKEYLPFLIKEIELYNKKCGMIEAVNLHLGGGSPTYLDSSDISFLFDKISEYISFKENAELSLEADPRNTTYQKLIAFKAAGFNRISFGVQDFDLKVQETINRVQSFDLVQSVCDMAREIGFENINFDLIYGLPFQTQQTIEETFTKVCKLLPNRIAFYNYAHLPGNFAAQNHIDKFKIPIGHERQILNFKGREVLLANGYTEIGMDHFALKDDPLLKAAQSGKLTRNFMGYTENFSDVTIGFGYSSISNTTDYFVQNVKDLKEYQKSLEDNRLPIAKGHVISEVEKQLRHKIIEIMTKFETNIDSFVEIDSQRMQTLIHDGLVVIDNNTLKVTNTGKIFLRIIASTIDPLQRV